MLRQEKKCTRCGRVKPRDQFYLRKSGPRKGQVYNGRCLDCQSAVHRSPSARVTNLRRQGARLTSEEFESIQLRDAQRCCICGKTEEEELRTLRRHLCVDHNHATGKPRGLLCASCNSTLGLIEKRVTAYGYEESRRWLLNAVDYLHLYEG